jgi:hypothetical protein
MLHIWNIVPFDQQLLFSLPPDLYQPLSVTVYIIHMSDVMNYFPVFGLFPLV